EREAGGGQRQALGGLCAGERLADQARVAQPAREDDRRGVGRRRAAVLEHALPGVERRGRGVLQRLGAIGGALGAGGGAARFLPGQRAAQLSDLLVEVLARILGELGEQLRALGPLAGGGERLAERLAQRDRAGALRPALLQHVDRGVELA